MKQARISFFGRFADGGNKWGITAWHQVVASCRPASNDGIMITGFRISSSRDHLLRLTVLFLRVASLGAAVAYAVEER